jgi:hypothetical protein
MTRAEEKAIKDEIIAAFVAEHTRQPTSAQVWVRFWADERVIARDARMKVEMAEAKRYWDALQLQQEAKK